MSISISTFVILCMSKFMVVAYGQSLNDSMSFPWDISTFIGSHVLRSRESGQNDVANPGFFNGIRRPALGHMPTSTTKTNFRFTPRMATSSTKTPITSISPKTGDASNRPPIAHMPTDIDEFHPSFAEEPDDSVATKVGNGECKACNDTELTQGSGRHPPTSEKQTVAPLINVTLAKAETAKVTALIDVTAAETGTVTHRISTLARAETENIVGLCGFPPYNDRETCVSNNYHIEPLSKCEKSWALVLFVLLVKILGVAIVVVNALIVIVAFRDPKMRSQYYAIKVSLAIADVIVGILVLSALLPNIFSIRYLPEEQIVKMIIENANSPGSIIAGAFLTVSRQASLLHLMILSIGRFVAIKWPFRHIRRRKTTVAAILITIWIVSIISAFTPAAFPDHFAYKFQPTILLHTMSLRPAPQLDWRGPVYAAFTLFVPYTITVTFCIMTGVVSYRKLRSAAQFFEKERRPIPIRRCVEDRRNASGEFEPSEAQIITKPKVGRKSLQPEISVFVTLIIMISAFTITLLPFTIVLILLVVKVLDCTNYTIPYVATFYIGLLNSLANGLIYSVRDKKFRKSAILVILSPKAICQSRN